MTVPRWAAKPTSSDPVRGVPFAQQLAHVDQAVLRHVGGPRVPHMRVVLPDDAPGAGAQVVAQPVDGVRHVVVPDVPGLPVAADHDPVVVLGVGRHLGVLDGVECFLVVVARAEDPAPHLAEQGHDVGLAGVRDQPRAPGVLVRVLVVRQEALPGAHGGGHGVGLVLLEPGDDLAQRVPERVDVQAVEADPFRQRPAGVPGAQPVQEPGDLLVRPHPGGPALEPGQQRMDALVLPGLARGPTG